MDPGFSLLDHARPLARCFPNVDIARTTERRLPDNLPLKIPRWRRHESQTTAHGIRELDVRARNHWPRCLTTDFMGLQGRSFVKCFDHGDRCIFVDGMDCPRPILVCSVESTAGDCGGASRLCWSRFVPTDRGYKTGQPDEQMRGKGRYYKSCTGLSGRSMILRTVK